jgi:hypothetical protein
MVNKAGGQVEVSSASTGKVFLFRPDLIREEEQQPALPSIFWEGCWWLVAPAIGCSAALQAKTEQTGHCCSQHMLLLPAHWTLLLPPAHQARLTKTASRANSQSMLLLQHEANYEEKI